MQMAVSTASLGYGKSENSLSTTLIFRFSSGSNSPVASNSCRKPRSNTRNSFVCCNAEVICIPVKEANACTMLRTMDLVHQIASKEWKTVENSADVRALQDQNVQIVLPIFFVV
jgi:hypothetical protein